MRGYKPQCTNTKDDRDYYEYLYGNKIDNLDGQILRKAQFSKTDSVRN